MSNSWKPGTRHAMIDGVVVQLIGDPHLDRKFRHGVPVDRLGDRERMQRDLFKDLLMNPGAPISVCMGDLFDKFVVSPTIVLFAAETYRAAAKANPDVVYVVIRGNHDGSRDSTLRSSFDLFERLVSDIENVIVASDAPEVVTYDGRMSLAFLGWHPFASAAEVVQELASGSPEASFHAVFGHWDVDDFGGENPNLIPAAELSEITSLVVNGHVHMPEIRKIGALVVWNTGSMMPYAHGEDLTGETYRTVKLAEAKQLAESGASKNMCLRIDLEADEELDFEIDCLQIQVRRRVTELDEVQTEFGDFDMKNLFDEVFAENGVRSDTSEDFWSRLRATNPDIV